MIAREILARSPNGGDGGTALQVTLSPCHLVARSPTAAYGRIQQPASFLPRFWRAAAGDIAMAFTSTQERRTVTVRTPDIAIDVLAGRRRAARTATHRWPQSDRLWRPAPSIDVQLGLAGEWLADRVFVRYLRHSVEERDGAVELVIVIGIGPLMVYDRYRITGTLIARRVSTVNVGEDEVQLHGVRLALPWARVGTLERCRFEAPGNNVRPHVPPTGGRRPAPRLCCRAGSLRLGCAMAVRSSQPSVQGPGLMALYDQETDEALLCWYYSACRGGAAAGRGQRRRRHADPPDRAGRLAGARGRAQRRHTVYSCCCASPGRRRWRPSSAPCRSAGYRRSGVPPPGCTTPRSTRFTRRSSAASWAWPPPCPTCARLASTCSA